MDIKGTLNSIGNAKIVKAILNPGVLFPIANIFAFWGSGIIPAALAAAGTAVVATAVSYANNNPESRLAVFFRDKGKNFPKFLKDQFSHPLRVNAWGVLAPTLAIAISAVTTGGITAAALLPMIAGTFFSSGSFAATSETCNRIQKDPKAKGWKKAITNPAVHWSVGYAALGLAAGGGAKLLLKPLSNIPALVMTALGITTTTASAMGLMRHKFSNPASPFMMLVNGTLINATAAVLTLNFNSVANMLCACSGEFMVGADVHRQQVSSPQAKAKTDKPKTDKSVPIMSSFDLAKQETTFRKVEYILNWPLRVSDRRNNQRLSAEAATPT
jgi:hypothetical protein